MNAKLNFQIIFLLESIFYANVDINLLQDNLLQNNLLQDNLQRKEISINNVVSTINNGGTDIVEENKENEKMFFNES